MADSGLVRFKKICKLPASGNADRLPRLRILERVLRLGISSFIFLDEEIGLAVRKGEIWRVNVRTGEVVLEMRIPGGKAVLALSTVTDHRRKTSTVMFGEYFENTQLDEVNLWGRPAEGIGEWNIIGTFPRNTINHVHSIVPAPERNGALVLTGDFDQAAGIWFYSPESGALTPVLVGSQAYRAAWLRKQGDDYVFATDSQLSQNYVSKLRFSANAANVEVLKGIEGSSIYVGMGEDITYFSSTVEPGAPTKNTVIDYLSNRPGPGILSTNAHIYAMTNTDDVESIFHAKADMLPLRLAQFGTFIFPSGLLPDGVCYAYGQALRKYDDCCMMFRRF
ncbi:hypothetical protein [Pandoraea cepalis]|uniref:Uncharacterized protein n=1 Tax=Pandoraea cepalis TaxID=2508294 RepID=A0A5E4YQ66_9BURK|nr:hypothetical protein [Pandoraea cepalis]VVE50083.1 hypothetical protein PCE31107_04645 [Pandoraea cepalis]